LTSRENVEQLQWERTQMKGLLRLALSDDIGVLRELFTDKRAEALSALSRIGSVDLAEIGANRGLALAYTRMLQQFDPDHLERSLDINAELLEIARQEPANE
jgi:hypothetical protein